MTKMQSLNTEPETDILTRILDKMCSGGNE